MSFLFPFVHVPPYLDLNLPFTYSWTIISHPLTTRHALPASGPYQTRPSRKERCMDHP